MSKKSNIIRSINNVEEYIFETIIDKLDNANRQFKEAQLKFHDLFFCVEYYRSIFKYITCVKYIESIDNTVWLYLLNQKTGGFRIDRTIIATVRDMLTSVKQFRIIINFVDPIFGSSILCLKSEVLNL